MCFESLGPATAPPRRHLAASERILVRADEGTAVAARFATTRDPSAPGVVLLPDVRGLHPYYEDLAERFADAGSSHETVVYPDAPHSFFDRTMTEHVDACADAWRRVLAFMGVRV